MSKHTHHYDVIIIGAGLVGSSLAAALRHSSLRIAILETHLPTAFTEHNHADPRPLTLNYASQQILKNLGLWTELESQSHPITHIHVSEQGRFGKLHFTAQEVRLPALGYVVPYTHLHQQLYYAINNQPNIHIIPIGQLLNLTCTAEGTRVKITTAQKQEQSLHAKVVIGADGQHSTTRQLCGIDTWQQSTGERALITTLHLQQPHQHTAYERFTPTGLLAVLPLFNSTTMRLVWTLSPDMWQQVSTWSATDWHSFLNEKLSGYLGPIKEFTPERQSFPLAMNLSQQQILPGLVLLGNAAHTIYPLAAQGFNLGLGDAIALAEVLLKAHQQQEPLGASFVLERYLKWREPEQRWMSQMTLGISQLFALQWPLISTSRSLGLLLMDACPPMKWRMGRHLLGMAGRLPRLLQGERFI